MDLDLFIYLGLFIYKTPPPHSILILIIHNLHQVLKLAMRASSYATKPSLRFAELKESLLSKTFYVVKKCGPTVFDVKDEEGEIFRVVLGNLHECNCNASKSTLDSVLCIHKVFILLKVMRVDEKCPLSWQCGLTDGEIVNMLEGAFTVKVPKPRRTYLHKELSENISCSSRDESSSVAPCATRQEVSNSEDDICPICQDLMSTDQALTWYTIVPLRFLCYVMLCH